MKNIEKYFLEEINKLNERSKEFVLKHPSLANMLSYPSSDPDVERLLEGVAFLNAFLQREIDSSFIQISKYILEFSFPNILKPLPASTILQIKPNKYLKEKLTIQNGTYFLANIDNKEFRFQNIWQMDIFPFEYEIINKKKSFVIKLNAKTEIKKVSFFLNLSMNKKFTLFKYLYNAKKIYVKTDDNIKTTKIYFSGLEKNVYGFNENYNPFILLEEYFNFIDKFFLLEVDINEKECEIIFEFENELPFELHKEDILFNCIPILNLFENELEPIELNYEKECIVLDDYSKYKIYNVEEVIGYKNGKKVNYHKFNGMQEFKHTYEIYDKKILDEDKQCLVIHLNSTNVEKEILSIKVLSFNENTELLKIGSINQSFDNTPELISFSNVTAVNSKVLKFKDENIWDLISYFNINLTGIKTADDFKKILKLFINEYSSDKNKIYKNSKKIESIIFFDIKFINKLYKGQLIQGMEVYLEINGEFFINFDEVFFFGLIIEYFLAFYVNVNNFVVLKIKEKISGMEFIYKEITGNKQWI